MKMVPLNVLRTLRNKKQTKTNKASKNNLRAKLNGIQLHEGVRGFEIADQAREDSSGFAMLGDLRGDLTEGGEQGKHPEARGGGFKLFTEPLRCHRVENQLSSRFGFGKLSKM